MTKKNKLILAWALGLFASFHASAETIEIRSLSGASANVNITLSNGSDYHTVGSSGISFSETGSAGSLTTYNASTGNTFQSWCADIFHRFSFTTSTQDTLVSASSLFGTTKANQLGSLYTLYAQNLVQNNSSSMNPAFQLAVWAVVNTPTNSPPSLTGSVFTASAGAAVDAQATQLLMDMGNTQSQYMASVWTVNGNTALAEGKPSAGAQDLLVFSAVSAVPEPASHAMLLAGLGLIGVAVNRRKAKQG
jgi:hypothetical protein